MVFFIPTTTSSIFFNICYVLYQVVAKTFSDVFEVYEQLSFIVYEPSVDR